jgi:hypothetical protein
VKIQAICIVTLAELPLPRVVTISGTRTLLPLISTNSSGSIVNSSKFSMNDAEAAHGLAILDEVLSVADD